jgi:hypothetical protein
MIAMDNLPGEIVEYIDSYLTCQDHINLKLVCKAIYFCVCHRRVCLLDGKISRQLSSLYNHAPCSKSPMIFSDLVDAVGYTRISQNLEKKHIVSLAYKSDIISCTKLLCKNGLKQEFEDYMIEYTKHETKVDCKSFYDALYEYHLIFTEISDRFVSEFVNLIKNQYKLAKHHDSYETMEFLIKILVLLMYLNSSNELCDLFVKIDDGYVNYDLTGFEIRIETDSRILTKPHLWNLISECLSVRSINIYVNCEHVIDPKCGSALTYVSLILNKEVSIEMINQIGSITGIIGKSNHLHIRYKLISSISTKFRKYLNENYRGFMIYFSWKTNYGYNATYWMTSLNILPVEYMILKVIESYIDFDPSTLPKVLLKFGMENEKILELIFWKKGKIILPIKYYSNKLVLARKYEFIKIIRPS